MLFLLVYLHSQYDKNKKTNHMKQLTAKLNPFTIAFIFYSVIFIINYLNN